MGEVTLPPTSPSCMFCLDTETYGMWVCTCPGDCGMPDCANAEKPFWYRPPVPKFGGPMPTPKKLEAVVPVDVVNIEPEDYGNAINRVVNLHERCDCKGCVGLQRAACKGCNDFWPCITIRTLRRETERFFDTPGDPVPAAI